MAESLLKEKVVPSEAEKYIKNKNIVKNPDSTKKAKAFAQGILDLLKPVDQGGNMTMDEFSTMMKEVERRRKMTEDVRRGAKETARRFQVSPEKMTEDERRAAKETARRFQASPRVQKQEGGILVPPEIEMEAREVRGDFAEGGVSQLFDQMGRQGDNINWDRWTRLTSEDPTGPIDPASRKGLQLIRKLDRQRRELGDRTFKEALSDFWLKNSPRGTHPITHFLVDLKARKRFTKENPELVETINSLKEQRERILELKKDQQRTNKQAGGSMLVPPEMEDAAVPVDTYPNIPPEEMAAVEASQLPDEQMEDDYVDFVMNEALDPEEQTYLMNALEADPQLSMIFDKVVDTASEFSGAGEVNGPGDGVSDSIPARLSDGEFVVTKKATDQLGADNLQSLMDEAERAFDGGLMSRDSGIEDEEIRKSMVASNQMPSLNVRQR